MSTGSKSTLGLGRSKSVEQLRAADACQELVIAFCDLMDEGDVDSALELHTDDIVFRDVDGAPVVGKAAAKPWLQSVRFRYPGRVTLHVPSNIRFSAIEDARAECRALVTLYELTRPDGHGGADRCAPTVHGVVVEDITFRRLSDGAWRFSDRVISFLTGAPPPFRSPGPATQ